LIQKHKKKLETIEQIIPPRKYRKLVRFSINSGGTPDYFVYDKINKEYFFISEYLNEDRNKWMKNTKKIVKTIVLEK
jgi:hypothetical protein